MAPPRPPPRRPLTPVDQRIASIQERWLAAPELGPRPGVSAAGVVPHLLPASTSTGQCGAGRSCSAADSGPRGPGLGAGAVDGAAPSWDTIGLGGFLDPRPRVFSGWRAVLLDLRRGVQHGADAAGRRRGRLVLCSATSIVPAGVFTPASVRCGCASSGESIPSMLARRCRLGVYFLRHVLVVSGFDRIR